MISPVTCVSMVLFAGSGLYLYQAKHQAEVETREIRRLVSEAEAIRQRAGMLVAEYQTESDQEVLGKLAARFLPQLRPTQPSQFVALADLATRLPPIGLPPPAVEAAPGDLVYAYPPAPSGAAAGEDGARLAALAARSAPGANDASRSKPVTPARPSVASSPPATPSAVPGASSPAAATTQLASAGRPAAPAGGAAASSEPQPGAVRTAARISSVVSTAPPYGQSAYGAPYAPGAYGAASYGGASYAAGAQAGQPVLTGSALGMARTVTPHPYAPPPALPQLWPGGSGG